MIATMKDIIATFKWGLKGMFAMALLICSSVAILFSIIYVSTHYNISHPFPAGLSKLEAAFYSLGIGIIVYFALLAITKSFVRVLEFFERLFR
ncbi:hypothetical protein NYR60_03390 [Actinobacillus genomosp. 2]|uniref:hypothetical protein n=1 Tax=Actinobacillus genomosp. 2 TaxID=230709 RepID=UPI002441BBE8|nr:hypothetical protein [Actinobacillus genomosp. 2]WGE32661.1 hypothetical protein NYR60_03390 [Actinobacillus genomosp. 2]